MDDKRDCEKWLRMVNNSIRSEDRKIAMILNNFLGHPNLNLSHVSFISLTQHNVYYSTHGRRYHQAPQAPLPPVLLGSIYWQLIQKQDSSLTCSTPWGGWEFPGIISPLQLSSIAISMLGSRIFLPLKKPQHLTHQFGAVLKKQGLCRMAYHLRTLLLWMMVLQLDLV